MKLILATNDGEVLGSVDVDHAEWNEVRDHAASAVSLLNELPTGGAV